MATSASHGEDNDMEMEMEVDEPTEDRATVPTEMFRNKDLYLDEDDPRANEPNMVLDSQRIHVDVEWPDQEMPKKGKTLLQKALQSLFNNINKNKGENYNVHSVQFMDNLHSAEVIITPASALEHLLQLKTENLRLKEMNMDIRVHFSSVTAAAANPSKSSSTTKCQRNTPMYFTAYVDLTELDTEVQNSLWKKYSKNQTQDGKLNISGSFEEIESIYREFCTLSGAANKENGPKLKTASQNSRPDQEHYLTPLNCPMPLFHYLYVSKVCGEEIQRIQKKFGVRFESMVSVTDEKENSKAEQAINEFIDLTQKCLSTSEASLMPGLIEEGVNDILRKNPRLQLRSPKESIGKYQRGEQMQSNIQSEYRQKSQPELTEPLLINPSQDPVAAGVCMSSIHWDIIQHVFTKQLEEIQTKFSVFFSRNGSSENITIRAHSPGVRVLALEYHAHRALMDLYQKTATSLLSCTLKNPNQQQMVSSFFENIPHPNVAVINTHGTWRLMGLQENLAPVVKKIEERFAGPVFNESDKFQPTHTGDVATKDRGATGGQANVTEENCPICMDIFINKKRLNCKHEFCSECLDQSVKTIGPQCPVCKMIFGRIEGDQPDGTMRYQCLFRNLPGFPLCGIIEIFYDIPDGIQTQKHPNPGKPFCGARRRAFLPDNAEGNEVLRLLKRAFDQRLIFTVGVSRTTGASDTVTWNDIHHKTCMTGGPSCFGYPDPDYLKRVKEELKAKGIQ